MDKKPIIFGDFRHKNVVFGNQTIAIKNYLSQAEMESLIESYLSDLVKFSMLNTSRAEMYLMLGILDFCTDIELYKVEKLESGEEEQILLVKPDMIYENFEFYTEVIKSIKNYEYFRELLEFSVQEVIEQRRIDASVGKVVGDFLKTVSEALSSITNGQITDENIAKIKDLLSAADSSKVASMTSLMDESKKAPKPKTTRKRKQ